MYIMKHTRKKKEKEKKMQIAKTYKITYKPFHYSDETIVFTGTVERFSPTPRFGDSVIIRSGKNLGQCKTKYHTLTVRNILSYEEI